MAKQDEVLHGVFELPGGQCVVLYCRLTNGLTRGAAIPQMVAIIKQRWNASTAKFHFWATGYSSNGGAPIVLG